MSWWQQLWAWLKATDSSGRPHWLQVLRGYLGFWAGCGLILCLVGAGLLGFVLWLILRA